jgi:hypothetical protein
MTALSGAQTKDSNSGPTPNPKSSACEMRSTQEMVRSGARKRVVHGIVKKFGISERRAFGLLGLHRSTQRFLRSAS